MRIERYLTDNARLRGDKTALVAGGRRVTYAELDDLTDRLAAALRDAGVRRNDRILVFMDNCWEAAVAIFATMSSKSALLGRRNITPALNAVTYPCAVAYTSGTAANVYGRRKSSSKRRRTSVSESR